MQFKGTLTTWKDEQGFGFAQTEQSAEKVFVHIKNFAQKTRRPIEGDVLVYRINTDAQGRKQATHIQFSHDYERQRIRQQRHDQKEGNKSFLSKLAAYPFILALLVLVSLNKIPAFVLAYYFIISLWTFYAYWADKQAAKENRRRTPEDSLHFYSLCGGWMGALVAQLTLRHKSQKQSFRETFWLTVIAHLIIFGLMVYFGAFQLLQQFFLH